MQLDLSKQLFNNVRNVKEEDAKKKIVVDGMCGMKSMKRELQEASWKKRMKNSETAKLNPSTKPVTKKRKHKKA